MKPIIVDIHDKIAVPQGNALYICVEKRTTSP